jgi:hypothetical protein
VPRTPTTRTTCTCSQSLSTSTCWFSTSCSSEAKDTPEQIAISGRPLQGQDRHQRNSLSSTRQPLVIHKATACHPQGSSLSSTRQHCPSHHKRKVLLPGAQRKEQLAIRTVACQQETLQTTSTPAAGQQAHLRMFHHRNFKSGEHALPPLAIPQAAGSHLMMTNIMIGIQHRDSTTGTISRNCLQPPPTGFEASIPINMVIAELTQQTSEMYGMIREMHISMNSQMADNRVGIPELREAFYNLIADHCIIVQSLADTLGESNPLVKELELVISLRWQITQSCLPAPPTWSQRMTGLKT